MNQQKKNFLILIVLLWISLIKSESSMCFLWKNAFVKIEKNFFQNETSLSVTIKTRQTKGWIGISFIPDKTIVFQNSFSIIGILKNQVVQFKNHTEFDTNLKYYDLSIPNTFNDIIDSIWTIHLKIKTIELSKMNHLQFSIFEQEMINTKITNETNISLMIPKHNSISDAISFALNSTQIYPPCADELNIPGKNYFVFN